MTPGASPLLLRLLFLTCLLLATTAAVANSSGITHEDVIRAVETVFPPNDGSTLEDAGLAGVMHLQPHVLGTLNGTGCVPFPANPQQDGTWAYDRGMLTACLWAKLGKMANEGVQSPGSAFAYFALNTMEGRVVRARQDTESQRSITVLSVLVIVLILGLGYEGYLNSSKVKAV